MSGDHHIGRCILRAAVERTFVHALRAQPLAHERIVHQLTEDGEWAGGGQCFRWAIASRTPKHIPKCSARKIFILGDAITLCCKVPLEKNSCFPRFYDLFEHVQVIRE